VVHVREPELRSRLLRILVLALEDNRVAWDLHADGHYTQRTPPPGRPVRDFHRTLMDDARERRERSLGTTRPAATVEATASPRATSAVASE
jgi:polyphosphate kinase